jgi:hypothetical protein
MMNLKDVRHVLFCFFPVWIYIIYICNMYVNSYYVCLSRDVPLTQLRQTPSPAMRFCGKRLKRLHFQIIHIWYNCIYYIYILYIMVVTLWKVNIDPENTIFFSWKLVTLNPCLPGSPC